MSGESRQEEIETTKGILCGELEHVVYGPKG